MKDKTHAMNRGFSGASEKGYEKLPDGEMASTRDRKKRQLKWANLDDTKRWSASRTPRRSMRIWM